MKRIICTVSNDLNHDQRMIRICTSLSNAGYQVQLVGRALPDSLPTVPQPFSQKRFKLWFNQGKLFYLALNLRLFWYLFFAKFDMVYSVDLDSLLPGRLVAGLRRKTCVFDAHEYFTEVPELIGRPLSKKIWELVAQITIPGLHYAITVCQSLADVLENSYGLKFEVIRNVPFRREATVLDKQPNTPFILIYQGVLNVGRGLEASILAMQHLPGAVLWVCGEGDLSNELRALATKNGLEKQVIFWGKLKPEALSALTAKADLGLNLLENKGLNYYYSLANKAFDYIQAGLPSIGMAFPEYIRLNESHGVFHLIEELSPASVAAAVTHLRNDGQGYQKLVTNCRVAAATLNWEEESKKLLAFFSRIA